MQRERWLEADRKALQVILAAGNRLVPVTTARASGQPIARCVTARKLKLNQATGELDQHDPFKSRHSVDGAYLEVQKSKLSKLAGASP